MKTASPEDAVGYFSQRVQHFHGRYRAQPEFQERVHLFHQLIDRYATPGGLFLDMGCGPGIVAFYLATKGGRVVGVDGAPGMISFCEQQRRERALENVKFIHARLPTVDEAPLSNADLLISSSVVEFVVDLDATLALFARLLKPRGVLIVSIPNRTSISRIHQRLKFKLIGSPELYRFIKHFSSPRALARRVRHHGLTLLEAHYYQHFTRLAKLGRVLRLPGMLTEDLFAAVFRKG